MKIAGLKRTSYLAIESGNRKLIYCYSAPPFISYYDGRKTIIKEITLGRFIKAVYKYAPENKFNGEDFIIYDTQKL
ncbi:hypothetical protein [uncultured Megamonas sp.]|uniref:hypothetical protein n=1 Tax=uncultured Megamonas sp. TaxID=286140 RepID=UPI00259B751F|nr:hypothetical protein [uncultured Megamonas sp.]